MTTEVKAQTSSKSHKIIEIARDQLPACCPPKELAHWNQHPRVYLELDKSGKAACPYCGNCFALTE
ncbi:zinc-finger domain-containing protein [Aliikangiella sp. G2MR2-5]|uniref:zinc-finger domain-containing protein n=1 Tax=Aliikangiella sp. G2MR2-5 TaxID=2788943 RepID=UPI0018AA703D|nr:zinc-finger domain-containing protein [Aliikangiella sp. G2MR2-5]